MALPISQSSNTNYSRGVQSNAFQILLLLVITVLAFWFLVKPKIAAVSEQKTRLTELDEIKRKTDETLETLNKLVADMRSHQNEVAALDDVLPLDSRLTKIHVMIERYTQNAGMSLANISVEVPDEKEVVTSANHSLLEDPFAKPRSKKTIETAIAVTGNMQQFQTFLQTIETSSRLYDIESIEIQGEDNGLIQFRLKLRSYYYQP